MNTGKTDLTMSDMYQDWGGLVPLPDKDHLERRPRERERETEITRADPECRTVTGNRSEQILRGLANVGLLVYPEGGRTLVKEIKKLLLNRANMYPPMT